MPQLEWIKIVTSIFDNEKMLLIESLPENDAILVIWFKLLCLAGKTDNKGVLLLNEHIRYTDEMFSTIFRRPLNTVRLALETFKKLGMIEMNGDTVCIPNWSKYQSEDSLEKSREYHRKYMQQKRLEQRRVVSLCDVTSDVNSDVNSEYARDVTVNVIEKDRDKELEKEKEVMVVTPPLSPYNPPYVPPPAPKTATATLRKNKNTITNDEIFATYSENIGVLTPVLEEMLIEWADEYSASWVIQAIQEAVLSNVKKPNYILTILKSWKQNGFKSKKSSGNQSESKPGNKYIGQEFDHMVHR